MTLGPQLPEKRKRKEDEASDSDSDSGSDVGPSLPSTATSAPKRTRIIGPTLPPASRETRPIDTASKSSEDGSDSSDDDDFGPSLPPDSESNGRTDTAHTVHAQPLHGVEAPAQIKRDDWMMVPPSGGDWTGRVDPTKLKNRKFQTGKGAKAPSTKGDASNTWHETPAEKQARLQREMMGIKDTASKPETSRQQSSSDKDMETAKRMQEYNKTRGPTLYQSHQGQKTEEDDDPSARAFDREKDIGGGLQVNATQRKDMMRKAADFSSRFSSAKYL